MCRIAYKIFCKALLVIAALGILSGCASVPPFKIIPTDDKFSDSSKQYGFIGAFNRLSKKSSQGGIHVDGKGVYLDPFVYKDRKTNEIIKIGFDVSHYNWSVYDGFRPIKKVIFLTDWKDRIVLKVKSFDANFKVNSWNTISKEYNTSFNEKGSGLLSKADFYRLAHAQYLEVKIVGRKKSQTYDKGEVLESFLKNLRTFYDAHFQ